MHNDEVVLGAWFRQGLESMGLGWPPGLEKDMEWFVDILIKTSKLTNLIGFKNRDDIYRYLLFDSIALWSVIYPEPGISVLDVGTGAGFPGVPMKLYFPEAKITLLDANGKKIQFLEEVTSFFGWEEKPVKHRVSKQNKINEFLKKYDIITAKAVGHVHKLSAFLWPYLKPEGRLVFFMGPRKEEELLYQGKRLVGSLRECAVPENSYSRKFYILKREELSVFFNKK